jgi:hypothetical protein
MKSSLPLLLCCLMPAVLSAETDGDQAVQALLEKSFSAADSLDVGEELSDDSRECLEGLIWPTGKFEVTFQPAASERGDLLVRFPSPVISGDVTNDLVSMEWYVVRDEAGKPVEAPAVVVIHESGRSMPVGRLFANGLRQRGLHTFLVHLPHYGNRSADGSRPDASNLITLIRQAIADVRRARDAVAVLPWIDTKHIALQGTSLGGFVAATIAGLDDGYDSIHVMLAGGDIYNLIQKGQRDTAKVREKLAEVGLTDEKLQRLTKTIEPVRLAHRVDPRRTWLYSGDFDTVVPIENALAWAEAAGLNQKHHIRVPANHYSGIVFLPMMKDHIVEQTRGLPPRARD